MIVRLGDISGRADFEQPLADRQVATLASPVHGSEAIIIRLGDVSGRSHLEQPLADRQVATTASHVHGSVAHIGRLGNVSSSLIQAFAQCQVP